MSEQSTGGSERVDRRGITHCYPHDNKMPCVECARSLKRYLNSETNQ